VSQSERGSVSAFLALLAVALLAVAGLVVDGGSALAAKRGAIDEAEQAARAGAAVLAESEVRSTSTGTGSAVSAAEDYMASAGHPGVAWVSGNQVAARVAYSKPTVLLGIVGVGSVQVSGEGRATNVHGVVREDS
jgi:Flp pilus assembly protein TadG